MRGLAAALAMLVAPGVLAQPVQPQTQPANSILLIAKPELRDPNFARSVVLVTQVEDGATVGVIVNRPSSLRLSQLLAQGLPTQNYKDPVYIGGPVMRQALVAVFRAPAPPRHAAFPVLKGVYLTLHHDNIARLLHQPEARYRLYAGFSGWAPRQLENELRRDDWYVLPADEATLFRASPEGLWEELLDRARLSGKRASAAKDIVALSVTATMTRP